MKARGALDEQAFYSCDKSLGEARYEAVRQIENALVTIGFL